MAKSKNAFNSRAAKQFEKSVNPLGRVRSARGARVAERLRGKITGGFGRGGIGILRRKPGTGGP